MPRFKFPNFQKIVVLLLIWGFSFGVSRPKISISIPFDSKLFYQSLSLFIEKDENKLTVDEILSTKQRPSYPQWKITIFGEDMHKDVALFTSFPEAILSLLVQKRVSYEEVVATLRINPDFVIKSESFLKEEQSKKSEHLKRILDIRGLTVFLNNPPNNLQESELLPGSIDYRRRVGTSIEFNRCEGRVGAYSGAFLVQVKTFLEADYGVEIDHTSPLIRNVQPMKSLRYLEAASFRTFDALNQAAEKKITEYNKQNIMAKKLKQQKDTRHHPSRNHRRHLLYYDDLLKRTTSSGTILKTSDPLDFHVNHFSGWAHWHQRHTKKASIDIVDSKEFSEADKSEEEHDKTSSVLSQLMENECALNPSLDGALASSLAVIPFWTGSVTQSGGNAHYEASSMKLKLQQVSGCICSTLRYFQRVVVGVCGEINGKALAKFLKHNWNIDSSLYFSNGSSHSPLFLDSGGVGVLEFECELGVHLPFLTLGTTQALIQSNEKQNISTFFSNIELIYYSEADQVFDCVPYMPHLLTLTSQVTTFRNAGVLHSLGGAIQETESRYEKDAVAVLLSPQRLVMRLTGHDLAKYGGSSLKTLSEVVNRCMALSGKLNHSNLIALTNACVGCPMSHCESPTIVKPSSLKFSLDLQSFIHSLRARDIEEPFKFSMDQNNKIETFETKLAAQRHWLIKHGFDPRDEWGWPSKYPSHSPSSLPSAPPSTQAPSHIPSLPPTPRPTSSPSPTHPVIWIARIGFILVVLLAFVAKIRIVLAEKHISRR